MTDVLLQELSNNDINWLTATGHRTEIATGTVIVQAGTVADTLYIVLDGTLAVTVSQVENPLGRAFAAIEGDASDREIARLFSGEVVGEIPFVGAQSTATTVRAVEPSLVLSIPQQQLAAKLQQDVEFAARFYRAVAILLSDRLQSVISRQLAQTKLVQSQPIRDMLFVLGELNDSDIDWLIATGDRQKVVANTVLINAGGPVDALYILLGGTLSVSASEDKRNPLARAFAALDRDNSLGQEIARLSKGEIVGETPFIDARLPATTVKTREDSLVLSIPRQQLAAKLQQDVGFAARFYRVIATLLSNRLQGMLSRLGYSRRVYTQGQPLDETIKYEDELDFKDLDHLALAGTRFDWMLKRLGEA